MTSCRYISLVQIHTLKALTQSASCFWAGIPISPNVFGPLPGGLGAAGAGEGEAGGRSFLAGGSGACDWDGGPLTLEGPPGLDCGSDGPNLPADVGRI